MWTICLQGSMTGIQHTCPVSRTAVEITSEAGRQALYAATVLAWWTGSLP